MHDKDLAYLERVSMKSHIPLHVIKEKQTLIDLVNASLRTCRMFLPQDAKGSFFLSRSRMSYFIQAVHDKDLAYLERVSMKSHIPLHVIKEKQTLIDLVNASLRTCRMFLPQDAKGSFFLSRS